MSTETRLDLGPTKELRRRLVVSRSASGRYWAGVQTQKGREFLAYDGGDRAYISRSYGGLTLCVGAQFPVTENEVKRLVETFGLKVRE